MSADERFLFSTCGEDVHVIDLESKELLPKIEGDGSVVTCFTVRGTPAQVIVASRSHQIRIINSNDRSLVRNFKANTILTFDYL